jgi:glycerate-2-kinase
VSRRLARWALVAALTGLSACGGAVPRPTNGPTDAAGAVADAAIVAAIEAQGLDVAGALMRCDAYPLLAASGGLIHTGPTGTNVADVRMVLVPG